MLLSGYDQEQNVTQNRNTKQVAIVKTALCVMDIKVSSAESYTALHYTEV